ncbi:hypothetical protein [Paraconexibacter algicola]|uniref:Uncharacterized protein n=1 Tax=Paraconexibacter algicola TaxID=2133960 RepID=A0A2T4UHE1_9ACTN|nr:hypothetical protein [Paraconexibacter algicola]PTL58664.1 hypothetical protein C7Y72_02850 [Paraconexibacter algicola]
MSGAAQVHLVGRRLTGMTFGKRGSAVYARLYDKSLEADPDALIRDHWAAQLGRPVGADEQAWRVEFELRGKFLRDLAVGDQQLMDADPRAFLEHHLDAVWEHLTTKWLVLKVPGSTTRLSRGKPQGWWAALSTSGGFGERDTAGPLVRRPRRSPDAGPLLAQLGGVLAAYAARRGTDDLDAVLAELSDYMSRSGGQKGFAQRVDRARLRLPLQARTRADAEAQAVGDDPNLNGMDDLIWMRVPGWLDEPPSKAAPGG